MRVRWLGCLLFLCGLIPAAMAAGSGPEAEWRHWREQRVQRLTSDESWTSLVGLHWLSADRGQWLGSGAENDIVIANVPERIGRLERGDDGWLFIAQANAGATVAGERVSGSVALLTDVAAAGQDTAPTRVRFDPVSFIVIERGDRHALRVWDRTAPSRTAFAGLDYFPYAATWRVAGTWLRHDPAREIEIVDVTGATQPMRNPGAVSFRLDDKVFRLEAIQEKDGDELFLIFADRSNRNRTYGAGRYLYAGAPDADGRVLLDFNYAYNPPCAFSAFATCPLPPPENRLDVEVTAGELRFDSEAH